MSAVGPLAGVTPARARDWASGAAMAAVRVPVPVGGPQAAVWTVRGWAEVAVGCAVLGLPAGYEGLDQVVRDAGVRVGGPFAARLRRLRSLGGQVPRFYPVEGSLPPATELRGRDWPVQPATWEACAALTRFCDHLQLSQLSQPGAATAAGPLTAALGGSGSGPGRSAEQLRWGAAYRPGPIGDHLVAAADIAAGLARRSWLSLPAAGGPVVIALDLPALKGTPRQRWIWRGIHDGAHLDHLAVLTRVTQATPTPAEFGRGLLLAESYAMAVEILAAVECLLAGDAEAVAELRAGLLQRMGRLPGAAPPPGEVSGEQLLEFAALPTLAESYVLGPLRLLAGDHPGSLLPSVLELPLRRRWAAACAAFPPAAQLTDEARQLR
jgi:hypothetical protein